MKNIILHLYFEVRVMKKELRRRNIWSLKFIHNIKGSYFIVKRCFFCLSFDTPTNTKLFELYDMFSCYILEDKSRNILLDWYKLYHGKNIFLIFEKLIFLEIFLKPNIKKLENFIPKKQFSFSLKLLWLFFYS